MWHGAGMNHVEMGWGWKKFMWMDRNGDDLLVTL